MFFKPKKTTKEYWLNWAAEQMKRGQSRQAVYNQLLHLQSSSRLLEEMQAISAAEHELGSIFVDRNLQGKDLEQQGQTDKAVALYEANIKDEFIGQHPYERLRIIYTKRKDWPNAIRVCQAYLKLPNAGDKKKAAFRAYLDKLKNQN